MKEGEFKARIVKELKKKGFQYYHVDVAAAVTGKKAFDGMLVKNGRVMAVEFKRNHRVLENHQRLELVRFDGAAIIIRKMEHKEDSEIIVSYPTGSVVFTTKIIYKEFAVAFIRTFRAYFSGPKLSKYTVHGKLFKKEEIKNG